MLPKRDESVLIIKDNGEECRRKILYVSTNRIEWRGGDCLIKDLIPNPIKHRKSKWILKQTTKQNDNI